MADMKISLTPNTATKKSISDSYTVFEQDQVLTHDQLNGVVEYLDDQARLTRVDLIGVGIYCGLRATVRTGEIQLSRGVGVTTDGDMVRFDAAINYTHYRPRDANAPVYTPLKNVTAWELLRDGTHPLAKPLTGFEANEVKFDTLSTLLLVECVDQDDDLCTGTDCDNRGAASMHTVRLLILDTAKAKTLVGAPFTPDTAARGLPDLVVDRPLIADVTSVEALTARYRAACNAIHGKLASEALPKLQPSGANSFLWDGPDPTPDWIQRLAARNQEFNSSTATGIQYYYDWLTDLAETYNALRERLSGDTTVCAPDLGGFPKHLALGRLVAADGPDPRIGFHPSPVVRAAVDRLGHARFLARRLGTLLSSWSLPALGDTTDVRITPSLFEDESLEGRSIPYYYSPTQQPAVHNNWSFALTRRGLPRNNLGYHAPSYGGLGEAARPLESALGRFSLFRVEGQLGHDIDQAAAAVDEAVRKYNLPIAVATALLPAKPPGAGQTVSGSRPLFDSVARQVPGLEHHAGALRGATLLLVCDETNRVVADFMLPATASLGEGCCTVVVAPGAGWESALSRLGDGKDACICFQAGEFVTSRTIVIAKKGRLKVTGAGAASRVIGPGIEVVLRFEDNTSVEIADLYVESQADPGAAGGGPRPRLGGAITIVNSDDIRITQVGLRCGSSPVTTSSCIAVYNVFGSARARSSSVRVHACDLIVGANQVGLSVINTGRVSIDDNQLRVDLQENAIIPNWWLKDPRFNASFIRSLLWGFGTGTPESGGLSKGGELVAINTVRGISRTSGPILWVHTPKGLAEGWRKAAAARKFPSAKVDRRTVGEYLTAIASDAVAAEGTVAGRKIVEFTKAIADLRVLPIGVTKMARAMAAQGIVVAGTTAREVRITANTVMDAVQGIHIGLSHRQLRNQGTPDTAGRVMIAGNHVRVLLGPESVSERHGIFVGNCDSLAIEDNRLECDRLATGSRLSIEGIRVYGFIGRMATIARNHLTGFTTGIRFAAVNHRADGRASLWRITENLAANAQQVVDLSLLIGSTSFVAVAANRG